jgi:peptidoglycan/LPS O-acetylase OafA/YrhL
MKRNESLDGARGLAALSVAIGHCITHLSGLSFYSNTIADFGSMQAWQIALRFASSVFNADAAVILFFVLSGHVLGRSLEGKRPRIDYFVRRIFRLLPAGIVAAAPFIWYFRPDFTTSLETALLVNHTVNGVIWSLQIEWIGSALIFMIAYLGGRPLALAAALFFAWYGAHTGNWVVLFLPAFCLGFLVPSIPAVIAHSRPLAALALATYLFADLVYGRGQLLRPLDMLAAFVLVAHINSRPRGILQCAPARFMGDVSYPFYLMGTFVMMVTTVSVGTSGATIAASVGLTAAISIPITLLAAYLVHCFVEMPGVQLGNWLLRALRRQPDQPSSAAGVRG